MGMGNDIRPYPHHNDNFQQFNILDTMQKTPFTDYSGTPISIGDTIEFQALIAYRKHRSKSKVYGFTKYHLLISCNGIRKEFRLSPGEVIKVYQAKV